MLSLASLSQQTSHFEYRWPNNTMGYMYTCLQISDFLHSFTELSHMGKWLYIRFSYIISYINLHKESNAV